MIKIFDYIPELDAFVDTKEYLDIATRIDLFDWHPVVWIGRLFARDNDFGEHWFDNHDERDALEEKAKALGYDHEALYIILPERFCDRDSSDGPCHTPEQRKRFWTDVCKSLHLSLETLFDEARKNNERERKRYEEHCEAGFPKDVLGRYHPNLEDIIQQVRIQYGDK